VWIKSLQEGLKRGGLLFGCLEDHDCARWLLMALLFLDSDPCWVVNRQGRMPLLGYCVQVRDGAPDGSAMVVGRQRKICLCLCDRTQMTTSSAHVACRLFRQDRDRGSTEIPLLTIP